MKLRIIGDPAPAPERADWPVPLEEGAPRVVIHDARGGTRDRALLAALRKAGLEGPVLLAMEGAPRVEALDDALGPGRLIRGRGAPLVEAVQREAGRGLALGAAAARAFVARLSIRVDPGLGAGALPPMVRGLPVDLTLRDPWPEVLMPLALGPLGR